MRSPQAFALGFGDFARLSVRAIFFFNFAQGDDNDKAQGTRAEEAGRTGFSCFRACVLQIMASGGSRGSIGADKSRDASDVRKLRADSAAGRQTRFRLKPRSPHAALAHALRSAAFHNRRLEESRMWTERNRECERLGAPGRDCKRSAAVHCERKVSTIMDSQIQSADRKLERLKRPRGPSPLPDDILRKRPRHIATPDHVVSPPDDQAGVGIGLIGVDSSADDSGSTSDVATNASQPKGRKHVRKSPKRESKRKKKKRKKREKKKKKKKEKKKKKKKRSHSEREWSSGEDEPS